MIVLDASVLMKWVLPEETGADAAKAYRGRHTSGAESVAVPVITAASLTPVTVIVSVRSSEAGGALLSVARTV